MRVFDHVVLPVADLAVSTARYEQLGFTSAPKGVHPFGTANRCIFFEEGGFLEPLVLENASLREAAMANAKGDRFVRDHQEFCEAIGPEGFSHLVLNPVDAVSDEQDFKVAGIFAGKTHFQRVAQNGKGDEQGVAFDLTFARDDASPLARFFTCQSLEVVRMDMAHLKTHANFVTGVESIYTVSDKPESHAEFLAAFCGAEPSKNTDGLTVNLGGPKWRVETPKVLAARLGESQNVLCNTDGMTHKAIAFRVEDLDKCEEHFAFYDISRHQMKDDFGDRIVVPPAAGQGFYALFVPA